MPWEDCYFAHTDDNRFTNTNCNVWFGIKDESEKDYSSKPKSIATAIDRIEVGGGGLGFGKRPYLHTDYAEMLKSTTDKEAFDRLAAGGYFPGRALLERPYESRHYQEMKYQKPVAPLLAETSPDLQLVRPEFEIPDIPGVPTVSDKGRPMWVHGYVCIADNVSRLKVCLTDDSTAEGIEVWDGSTYRFTKDALVDSRQLSIYIFNIAQVRQTSPYVYLYFLVDGTWRKCTSTECGGVICSGVEAIPGRDVWINDGCTYFDNTHWEITGVNFGSWETTYWESDQVVGDTYHRLRLNELGTWVEGYKPNYLKLTFSGVSTLNVYLAAGSWGQWIVSRACVLGTGATSRQMLPISWATYPDDDIINLYCHNNDCTTEAVFYITNIEFF